MKKVHGIVYPSHAVVHATKAALKAKSPGTGVVVGYAENFRSLAEKARRPRS